MKSLTQTTFDTNTIPKNLIFPHSKDLYQAKINELYPSPCFTNTHKVSPLKTVVSKPKMAKKLVLNRKQHRNYCEKHFARYSDTKARGRYLHFNSKYNPKLFLNKKTGEYGLFKEDLAKKYKEDFILTTMLWNEVEKQAKKQGLIGVFFTSTVIGELHPFGAKNITVREGFDYENNFKYAYTELQQLHKDIRIQSSRTLGYSPTFFKATEYHKTFIPHTHTVYFVKPADIDKFLTILENKTALKTQIGRTDTQVLNKLEENYAVPYLLKYLSKTALNMTIEQLKVFDGWKRALGIKQLYSNSRLTLSKWVIKKARYYFGETTPQGELNKDYWANNYDTLYACILDNTKVVDKVYDIEENLMRTRIIKEGVNKEKILIERDRVFNIKIIEVNEEPFILGTSYKTKRFIVKKVGKYHSKVVYDKSHYEMVEMTQGENSKNNEIIKKLKTEKLLNEYVSEFLMGINETEEQKEQRELFDYINAHIASLED